MATNTDSEKMGLLRSDKSLPSIYEISTRARFIEFLMDENESAGKMICEKCMDTWDGYYESLSNLFKDNMLMIKYFRGR